VNPAKEPPFDLFARNRDPLMKKTLSSPLAEAPISPEESASDPASLSKTTTKPKLLIVDDDEEIRTQMRWALAADYTVTLAADRASAIEQFRSTRPPVILLDLGLPPHPGTPEEGLKALSELLAIDRMTKVVIVSGQGEKGPALSAIGAGAYDFVGNRIEMDELKLAQRCFQLPSSNANIISCSRHCAKTRSRAFGTGARMQTVFDSIRKVATTDAPVLILGESTERK
jgi:two-component system NtrC family response regulator